MSSRTFSWCHGFSGERAWEVWDEEEVGSDDGVIKVFFRTSWEGVTCTVSLGLLNNRIMSLYAPMQLHVGFGPFGDPELEMFSRFEGFGAESVRVEMMGRNSKLLSDKSTAAIGTENFT